MRTNSGLVLQDMFQHQPIPVLALDEDDSDLDLSDLAPAVDDYRSTLQFD